MNRGMDWCHNTQYYLTTCTEVFWGSLQRKLKASMGVASCFILTKRKVTSTKGIPLISGCNVQIWINDTILGHERVFRFPKTNEGLYRL